MQKLESRIRSSVQMAMYRSILLGVLIFVQYGFSQTRKPFKLFCFKPMLLRWRLGCISRRVMPFLSFANNTCFVFSIVNRSKNDTINCHGDLQTRTPGAYCKVWGLPSWSGRQKMFRVCKLWTSTLYNWWRSRSFRFLHLCSSLYGRPQLLWTWYP